ncbi:sugar ABC transporter permease [Candidatus Flexifilum breve]|uniref:carbohydrate ABC transporter permease n=1 Tax=Candidatus Flexifilum breve TaxID=3140694 RepID=UPI0031CCADC6
MSASRITRRSSRIAPSGWLCATPPGTPSSPSPGNDHRADARVSGTSRHHRQKFFRTVYYLPVVTSWVVVSFLFVYLFSAGDAGLINFILMKLGVIDGAISWLASSDTAWIAIDSLGIWKGIGWAMVIFLAALQGIPTELYEAAAIDGANEWQRLRFMTLPLIRRTIFFVLIALMIGGFQVFISVLLITGGGPLHRTEVALTYMFDEAFGSLHFGYGAALSYVLAVVIVLVSLVQSRLFGRGDKDVEY